MNTLISNICHGNINLPSALVLIVLIIVCGWVIVTFIRNVF